MEHPNRGDTVLPSAGVPVATPGRLKKHRVEVPLYEVTEHQLQLITLSGNDTGLISTYSSHVPLLRSPFSSL